MQSILLYGLLVIFLIGVRGLSHAQVPYCLSPLLNHHHDSLTGWHHLCVNEPFTISLDTSSNPNAPCPLGSIKFKRVWYILDSGCINPNFCFREFTDTTNSFRTEFNVPGVYNLCVRILDSNNHQLSGVSQVGYYSYFIVSVCPLHADFVADHDTICRGGCVNYTDTSEGYPWTYNWYFEGGSRDSFSANHADDYTRRHPPPICYDDTGDYTTTLYTVAYYPSISPPKSPVVDSAKHKIHVKECTECLAVPTAFTPNGDHVNDTYYISTQCTVAEYQMRIYNRWGMMVYEGTDILSGWDGKYEGTDQPADIYSVYIHVQLQRGGVEDKVVTISLIR